MAVLQSKAAAGEDYRGLGPLLRWSRRPHAKPRSPHKPVPQELIYRRELRQSLTGINLKEGLNNLPALAQRSLRLAGCQASPAGR